MDSNPEPHSAPDSNQDPNRSSTSYSTSGCYFPNSIATQETKLIGYKFLNKRRKKSA